MKSALVAAVAALTEEQAVALWSVVAQWADNARNFLNEDPDGDAVTRTQLEVAERIERAGEGAMAERATPPAPPKICGASVTRSGGYWDGTCQRPAGHTGTHRKRPTHADRAQKG